MGILANIFSKLGLHHDQPASAPSAPAAPAAAAPSSGAAPAATAAPAPMSQVDIVAKLDGLAAQTSEKLDWRQSIVDLMKLLGLDSSFGARKQLATELNCPANLMADSAQMNIWLHKTVLQQLAQNGGNVPADLIN